MSRDSLTQPSNSRLMSAVFYDTENVDTVSPHVAWSNNIMLNFVTDGGAWDDIPP